MWNTVLFDLDGTLTDSGEGITKSVQYALKKGFGIEALDLNELRQFVGPPLKEQFMQYANLTEEEGEYAVECYRERYSVQGIYENALYDGIGQLIADLRREGFRIALSSSKPTIYCRQILDTFHLTQYFDVIVGSELDGSRVDKAEVIEEVFRQFGPGVRREEAVLVGDRNYDVNGAKKAGISSIGVTYGYGSREELEAAWPDCIVDSTEELRNVLIGQYRDGMRKRDPQAAYKEQYRDKFGKSGVRRYAYDGSRGHRIFRLISPFLIALAISLVMGSIAEIIALSVNGFDQAAAMPLSLKLTMIMTGVMDVILFLIMYFMWKKDEQLRQYYRADERILRKNRFGITEALTLLCAVELVSVCSSAISSALIPMSEGYEMLMDSMNSIPPWISFILVAFIAPFSEEMLFRGVIYRRARDYYNIYIAALISAVLFGVFHMNLSQGIPAAVLGFVFCLFYEHYGTLKANILCHILINIIGSISILTDQALINSIMTTIMIVIALIGIYGMYHIFKKEPKVNQI